MIFLNTLLVLIRQDKEIPDDIKNGPEAKKALSLFKKLELCMGSAEEAIRTVALREVLCDLLTDIYGEYDDQAFDLWMAYLRPQLKKNQKLLPNLIEAICQVYDPLERRNYTYDYHFPTDDLEKESKRFWRAVVKINCRGRWIMDGEKEPFYLTKQGTELTHEGTVWKDGALDQCEFAELREIRGVIPKIEKQIQRLQEMLRSAKQQGVKSRSHFVDCKPWMRKLRLP
jgi:hypothetical protein